MENKTEKFYNFQVCSLLRLTDKILELTDEVQRIEDMEVTEPEAREHLNKQLGLLKENMIALENKLKNN